MKFTRLKLLFITIIFSLICSTGCNIEGNYNTNPDSQQNEKNQEARNKEIAAKNAEAKLNAEAKRNNETKLNEQAKLDNEAKRNLQALKNIEQKLEVLQNAIAAQNNEALANKEAALNAEALNNYIYAHLDELRQEVQNNIIAAKNAETKANAEVQQNKLAAKNAEAKANNEAQENAVASQNAEAKANLEALENIAKHLEVLQNTIAAQNAEALANEEAAQNAEALNNYIYAHLEELRQEVLNNIIAAQNAEAAANIEARNNAIALAALGIQVNPSFTFQTSGSITGITAVNGANKITFTGPESFTSYTWTLDDSSQTGSERTFELNTTNLSGDSYTLYVEAYKDTIPYSATVEFTVDKTPCAEVSNVTVSRNNTTVTLSWTNPGDSDFAKVKIYYMEGNTQKTKEVTGTSTTITVNEAKDTYNFTIKTLDTAANESEGVVAASIKVLQISSDHTDTASEAKIESKKRYQFRIKTGMVQTEGDVYTFKFRLSDTSAVSGVTIRGTGSTDYKFYDNKSLSSFTQGTGIWQGWYEATCTAANDNSYMGFTFNCESGPIIDANTLVYIGDVKKNGTPVKESTLIGYEYSNIAPISTYINLSDAQ